MVGWSMFAAAMELSTPAVATAGFGLGTGPVACVQLLMYAGEQLITLADADPAGGA